MSGILIISSLIAAVWLQPYAPMQIANLVGWILPALLWIVYACLLVGSVAKGQGREFSDDKRAPWALYAQRITYTVFVLSLAAQGWYWLASGYVFAWVWGFGLFHDPKKEARA